MSSHDCSPENLPRPGHTQLNFRVTGFNDLPVELVDAVVAFFVSNYLRDVFFGHWMNKDQTEYGDSEAYLDDILLVNRRIHKSVLQVLRRLFGNEIMDSPNAMQTIKEQITFIIATLDLARTVKPPTPPKIMGVFNGFSDKTRRCPVVNLCSFYMMSIMAKRFILNTNSFDPSEFDPREVVCRGLQIVDHLARSMPEAVSAVLVIPIFAEMQDSEIMVSRLWPIKYAKAIVNQCITFHRNPAMMALPQFTLLREVYVQSIQKMIVLLCESGSRAAKGLPSDPNQGIKRQIIVSPVSQGLLRTIGLYGLMDTLSRESEKEEDTLLRDFLRAVEGKIMDCLTESEKTEYSHERAPKSDEELVRIFGGSHPPEGMDDVHWLEERELLQERGLLPMTDDEGDPLPFPFTSLTEDEFPFL